jgi:hypothetical protein
MGFFKSVRAALGIEIETPNYEVLKTLADNIEIRKYPPTKWATAKLEMNMNQSEFSSDSSILFRQLFRYITGTNTESQKIAMTSPVKFDYTSKDNKEIVKNSKCEMTMSFYVPQEFNNNTPKPTGDNMGIEEIPEMIVACSRFGGYASVDDYMRHRDLILQALGPEESKNYDSINLLTAGYDPPFKPFYRRNEVWLRKIK